MSEQTPQSQALETETLWETDLNTGPTLDQAHPIAETDWFTLARKLRQRNRELLQRAADLEQALAKTQDSLQSERRLTQKRERFTVQQSEELLGAQAQMNLLFQELEASHNVAQRQHFLIESLSQQLETAQNQIARLEQECILARQTYTEQANLLSEAADNSQALRQHLDRQQTHTQQFRAVFSRYLESGDANPVLWATEPNAEEETFPRAQGPALVETPPPIQPWSTQQSQALPEPPAWAARLLDDEVEQSETTTVEAIRIDEPTPQPGKFANLILPDFHGRTGRKLMPMPKARPQASPAPNPLRPSRPPQRQKNCLHCRCESPQLPPLSGSLGCCGLSVSSTATTLGKSC
ncbi:MAG: hypothetical protein EA366_15315 [Spirulina sp. DLM2.Bin59]|nr:MAG: hypothetical protein EA366_15315 [Spirulina sp. DLM2.Bin59]